MRDVQNTQCLLNVEHAGPSCPHVTLQFADSKGDVGLGLVKEGLVMVEPRKEKQFQKVVSPAGEVVGLHSFEGWEEEGGAAEWQVPHLLLALSSLQITEYLNAQEAAKSSRVSQLVDSLLAQEQGGEGAPVWQQPHRTCHVGGGPGGLSGGASLAPCSPCSLSPLLAVESVALRRLPC